MAAAPVNSNNGQSSDVAVTHQQPRTPDSSNPHMLVKTILPPSKIVTAVEGKFTRSLKSSQSSGHTTSICSSVAATPPSCQPIPGCSQEQPTTEVVLATLTSLMLIVIDSSANPADVEEMATSDSYSAPQNALDNRSSRKVCEQQVFGTIVALATLQQQNYKQLKEENHADMLLMLTLESPELLVLQYSHHHCRFEVMARLATNLEGCPAAMAVSPDSSAIAISCAGPGNPMVIRVMPRNAAAEPSRFAASVEVPLIQAAARSALLSDEDKAAVQARAEALAAVRVISDLPQPVSVVSLCFCSAPGQSFVSPGEVPVPPPPPLLAVLAEHGSSPGRKRSTLWQCAIPRHTGTGAAEPGPSGCDCTQVAQVALLPQELLPPQEPLHDFFTGVSAIPRHPSAMMLTMRGNPKLLVFPATASGESATMHRFHSLSQQSSVREAKVAWCWEEFTSEQLHESAAPGLSANSKLPPIPAMLIASPSGSLLRLPSFDLDQPQLPAYGIAHDARALLGNAWLVPLHTGCLLAASRQGGAQLLAPHSHSENKVYTPVATVAVGGANVASPLIAADLAEMAQPQIYSVCDSSEGHITVVRPNPVPELIFESAADYGGVTGLWALPSRPNQTSHSLVILSFVHASRALSTLGETLTDATEVVALSADSCTIDAGCIADLLAAQVTSSHIQLCSLRHLALESEKQQSDENVAPGTSECNSSPKPSMGKRHASWATMEGISDAFAAHLSPFANDSDCSRSTAASTPWQTKSTGHFITKPPIRHSSCGRLSSFARDFPRHCSFASELGSIGDAQEKLECADAMNLPEPVDLWFPPTGSSISVAKVVRGTVLFSYAGSKELFALIAHQLEHKSETDGMHSGSGSSKRKRDSANDGCSPSGTLVLAASAAVAAEMSCITACQPSSLRGQPGTLVCVGTHAPTIELLLLTKGSATKATNIYGQQPQLLHLLRLAHVLLQTPPQQLPDLWPENGEAPVGSAIRGAAAAAACASFGIPMYDRINKSKSNSPAEVSQAQRSANRPAFEARSNLDSVDTATPAEQQPWADLQHMLSTAVGCANGTSPMADALQAQHNIPESALLLPRSASNHVQVLVGLRNGGLLKIASSSLSGTWSDTGQTHMMTPGSSLDDSPLVLHQVGHVQQLGSIPISLVQLSSAAAGDSGSSDGSPNLCSEGSPVALALGERPWLLRWPGNSGGELGGGTGSDSRYDSGGSSAGTPKGSLGGSLGGNRSLTDDRALVWPTAVPLSERRLLRAAGLILPGTDDVESSRCLVLAGSADGQLRLMNVAKLSQIHSIPLQISQLPESAQGHSCLSPPSLPKVTSSSSVHKMQPLPCYHLSRRHLALHSSSALLIAVLQVSKPHGPSAAGASVAADAHLVVPEALLVAVHPQTGTIEARYTLPAHASVSALSVWPTSTDFTDLHEESMEGEHIASGTADEAAAMDVEAPARAGYLRTAPVSDRAATQQTLPGQQVPGAQQHQQLSGMPQPQQPGQGSRMGPRSDDRETTACGKGAGSADDNPDSALDHQSEQLEFVVVATDTSLPPTAEDDAAKVSCRRGSSALQLLRLTWCPPTGATADGGDTSELSHSTPSTGQWRFIAEGSVRTRSSILALTPLQTSGRLLAISGRTLTAFRLDRSKGHHVTSCTEPHVQLLQEDCKKHGEEPEGFSTPNWDENGSEDWSFGLRRQRVRGKPGGTGSFDGHPFPLHPPTPPPHSTLPSPSSRAAPVTWTLVREARQQLWRDPKGIRPVLHADTSSGAIAVCDSHHALQLLTFDPARQPQQPFQIMRTSRSARPIACCLALPATPASPDDAALRCSHCGVACEMVEDGRGVSGDSAGVLSVLVPDREHYGPERNLVPAATFCLGGPVTTLTSGCLRFDGQQSAGDGSSIVKGTLAGGVMSARVEEPLSLPVAHSSLHSATAPTSLSGNGEEGETEGTLDRTLSFVAACGSGSLVTAHEVSPSTHALCMALQAALCEDPSTAPLSGTWHTSFRSHGLGSSGSNGICSSAYCSPPSTRLHRALMADGDLLASFFELSLSRQEACVQKAVMKLATPSSRLSTMADVSSAQPPPLGTSQLTALTVAVATRLESVLGDEQG